MILSEPMGYPADARLSPVLDYYTAPVELTNAPPSHSPDEWGADRLTESCRLGIEKEEGLGAANTCGSILHTSLLPVSCLTNMTTTVEAPKRSAGSESCGRWRRSVPPPSPSPPPPPSPYSDSSHPTRMCHVKEKTAHQKTALQEYTDYVVAAEARGREVSNALYQLLGEKQLLERLYPPASSPLSHSPFLWGMHSNVLPDKTDPSLHDGADGVRDTNVVDHKNPQNPVFHLPGRAALTNFPRRTAPEAPGLAISLPQDRAVDTVAPTACRSPPRYNNVTGETSLPSSDRLAASNPPFRAVMSPSPSPRLIPCRRFLLSPSPLRTAMSCSSSSSSTSSLRISGSPRRSPRRQELSPSPLPTAPLERKEADHSDHDHGENYYPRERAGDDINDLEAQHRTTQRSRRPPPPPPSVSSSVSSPTMTAKSSISSLPSPHRGVGDAGAEEPSVSSRASQQEDGKTAPGAFDESRTTSAIAAQQKDVASQTVSKSGGIANPHDRTEVGGSVEDPVSRRASSLRALQLKRDMQRSLERLRGEGISVWFVTTLNRPTRGAVAPSARSTTENGMGGDAEIRRGRREQERRVVWGPPPPAPPVGDTRCPAHLLLSSCNSHLIVTPLLASVPPRVGMGRGEAEACSTPVDSMREPGRRAAIVGATGTRRTRSGPCDGGAKRGLLCRATGAPPLTPLSASWSRGSEWPATREEVPSSSAVVAATHERSTPPTAVNHTVTFSRSFSLQASPARLVRCGSRASPPPLSSPRSRSIATPPRWPSSAAGTGVDFSIATLTSATGYTSARDEQGVRPGAAPPKSVNSITARVITRRVSPAANVSLRVPARCRTASPPPHSLTRTDGTFTTAVHSPPPSVGRALYTLHQATSSAAKDGLNDVGGGGGGRATSTPGVFGLTSSMRVVSYYLLLLRNAYLLVPHGTLSPRPPLSSLLSLPANSKNTTNDAPIREHRDEGCGDGDERADVGGVLCGALARSRLRWSGLICNNMPSAPPPPLSSLGNGNEVVVPTTPLYCLFVWMPECRARNRRITDLNAIHQLAIRSRWSNARPTPPLLEERETGGEDDDDDDERVGATCSANLPSPLGHLPLSSSSFFSSFSPRTRPLERKGSSGSPRPRRERSRMPCSLYEIHFSSRIDWVDFIVGVQGAVLGEPMLTRGRALWMLAAVRVQSHLWRRDEWLSDGDGLIPQPQPHVDPCRPNGVSVNPPPPPLRRSLSLSWPVVEEDEMEDGMSFLPRGMERLLSGSSRLERFHLHEEESAMPSTTAVHHSAFLSSNSKARFPPRETEVIPTHVIHSDCVSGVDKHDSIETTDAFVEPSRRSQLDAEPVAQRTHADVPHYTPTSKRFGVRISSPSANVDRNNHSEKSRMRMSLMRDMEHRSISSVATVLSSSAMNMRIQSSTSNGLPPRFMAPLY